MLNETTFHAPFDLSGTNSILAITPTPISPAQSNQLEPPTGWVFAGILVILLGMMLFNTIKKYVLKFFKKEKPSPSRKKNY